MPWHFCFVLRSSKLPLFFCFPSFRIYIFHSQTPHFYSYLHHPYHHILSVLVMDSSRLVPLRFQHTDSKQLLFKRVLRFSIFPIAFVLNVFNRFFKRALPQKKKKQNNNLQRRCKRRLWHCVINSTCSVNLLFLLFTHSSSNCKTFLCSFGYSCPLRLWPLIN